MNIFPFLWINKFNNPKKIYYTFADIGSVDGGEAGVPMGSTYLGAKYNNSKQQILKITLHELHHAQGGGFICVPGMAADSHWKNRDKKNQLGHGLALGATYIHNEEGCPQLVDSVYLTPTSEDPYDPFKVICLEYKSICSFVSFTVCSPIDQNSPGILNKRFYYSISNFICNK